MPNFFFLLGRVLLSLVFVGSGIGHLTQTEGTAQYAAYKKVPSPKLMTQLSGVLMLAGGVAMILGLWADLAGLGICILCLIMAFMMHRFWEETDPQTKQTEMAAFMKNVSIAGGALIVAWLYSQTGGKLPMSLTEGLFS